MGTLAKNSFMRRYQQFLSIMLTVGVLLVVQPTVAAAADGKPVDASGTCISLTDCPHTIGDLYASVVFSRSAAVDSADNLSLSYADLKKYPSSDKTGNERYGQLIQPGIYEKDKPAGAALANYMDILYSNKWVTTLQPTSLSLGDVGLFLLDIAKMMNPMSLVKGPTGFGSQLISNSDLPQTGAQIFDWSMSLHLIIDNVFKSLNVADVFGLTDNPVEDGSGTKVLQNALAKVGVTPGILWPVVTIFWVWALFMIALTAFKLLSDAKKGQNRSDLKRHIVQFVVMLCTVPVSVFITNSMDSLTGRVDSAADAVIGNVNDSFVVDVLDWAIYGNLNLGLTRAPVNDGKDFETFVYDEGNVDKYAASPERVRQLNQNLRKLKSISGTDISGEAGKSATTLLRRIKNNEMLNVNDYFSGLTLNGDVALVRARTAEIASCGMDYLDGYNALRASYNFGAVATIAETWDDWHLPFSFGFRDAKSELVRKRNACEIRVAKNPEYAAVRGTVSETRKERKITEWRVGEVDKPDSFFKAGDLKDPLKNGATFGSGVDLWFIEKTERSNNSEAPKSKINLGAGEPTEVNVGGKFLFTPVDLYTPRSYLYGAVLPGGVSKDTASFNSYIYVPNQVSALLMDPDGDGSKNIEISDTSDKSKAIRTNAYRVALANRTFGIDRGLSDQSVAFILQTVAKPDRSGVEYKGYNTIPSEYMRGKNTGKNGNVFTRYTLPARTLAEQNTRLALLQNLWLSVGLISLAALITLVKTPLLTGLVKIVGGFFKSLFKGNPSGFVDMIIYTLACRFSIMMYGVSIYFGVLAAYTTQNVIDSVIMRNASVNLDPGWGESIGNNFLEFVSSNTIIPFVVAFVVCWPWFRVHIGGQFHKASMVTVAIIGPFMVADIIGEKLDGLWIHWFGQGGRGTTRVAIGGRGFDRANKVKQGFSDKAIAGGKTVATVAALGAAAAATGGTSLLASGAAAGLTKKDSLANKALTGLAAKSGGVASSAVGGAVKHLNSVGQVGGKLGGWTSTALQGTEKFAKEFADDVDVITVERRAKKSAYNKAYADALDGGASRREAHRTAQLAASAVVDDRAAGHNLLHTEDLRAGLADKAAGSSYLGALKRGVGEDEALAESVRARSAVLAGVSEANTVLRKYDFVDDNGGKRHVLNAASVPGVEVSDSSLAAGGVVFDGGRVRLMAGGVDGGVGLDQGSVLLSGEQFIERFWGAGQDRLDLGRDVKNLPDRIENVRLNLDDTNGVVRSAIASEYVGRARDSIVGVVSDAGLSSVERERAVREATGLMMFNLDRLGVNDDEGMRRVVDGLNVQVADSLRRGSAERQAEVAISELDRKYGGLSRSDTIVALTNNLDPILRNVRERGDVRLEHEISSIVTRIGNNIGGTLASSGGMDRGRAEARLSRDFVSLFERVRGEVERDTLEGYSRVVSRGADGLFGLGEGDVDVQSRVERAFELQASKLSGGVVDVPVVPVVQQAPSVVQVQAPSVVQAPPVVQVQAPVVQAQAPVVQAPAPVVQAPVQQAQAPVVQAQAPVQQAQAPVVQAQAPVQQAQAPVQAPNSLKQPARNPRNKNEAPITI